MKFQYFVLFFGWLLSLAVQAQNVDPAQRAGNGRDPARLNLASVNALVMDMDHKQVLFAKNADAVVPIASVSKLMTVMVALDANQPLDEVLPIKIDQTRELKGVFSRVRVGSQLTRKELILLTLMSSENRAAATLAHHYKFGYAKFIDAMNKKAKDLGLKGTQFVEPTGLSYSNVSTARDLAKLVQTAAKYPLIRQSSTTAKKDTRFKKPNYSLAFYNTNPLVRNNKWDIRLSKTGFNNKAGHCLVMLTEIDDRQVAVVLLDSFGKRSHVGDAARVKQWLETGKGGTVPTEAKNYERRKNRLSAT
ncbi:MAG: D-alanyl-D-alanine endopeptidase [Gammaproteobacteria bacterium]|nr:D-alanyl-D-alanine endopeptidase [Gammaproteobacteria bacterium]